MPFQKGNKLGKKFQKGHKLNIGRKRPDLTIFNKSKKKRKQLSQQLKGRKHEWMTGSNNWNWKGGICKTRNRIYIKSPGHPFAKAQNNYVARSRLVMEKKIGRFLKPEEVVHHINNNTLDDRPENLMLFPNQSAHAYHHKTNC